MKAPQQATQDLLSLRENEKFESPVQDTTAGFLFVLDDLGLVAKYIYSNCRRLLRKYVGRGIVLFQKTSTLSQHFKRRFSCSIPVS